MIRRKTGLNTETSGESGREGYLVHAWEGGVGFQQEGINKWSQPEEVGELSRQCWWEPGVRSPEAQSRAQRLRVRPRGAVSHKRKKEKE